MDRNALVSQKAEEIEDDLERWARDQGILAAGERLVFSLRIENRGRLVQRDRIDLEPFRISTQCREKFKGQFLRPADLAGEAVREILGRLPAGRVYDEARELLIENDNAPSRLRLDVVHGMNRALADPVGTTHYRVALGKDAFGIYCAQLWEVAV